MCPSSCLQRWRSIPSTRSGGSCWSWLWWDSSSFWSWSSLCCCTARAPSTRPVAQVCSPSAVMFHGLIWGCVEKWWIFQMLPFSHCSGLLLRSPSTGAPRVPSADLLHCSPQCVPLKTWDMHHLMYAVCLQQPCSYRAADTSEAVWQRKTGSASLLQCHESGLAAPAASLQTSSPCSHPPISAGVWILL